ncbi:MAG: branched-chain amino acid ABC transporter permease [Betaproteobacteria bacterium]|nr:MAG: branched-chain amino acid ABC transporter permease [Betaproteobacteria bacterium]
MPEGLVQVILDGSASGTIYAAVALALVLVYKSSGIVNFAQGEMGMFCTFITWWLNQQGLGLLTAIASGLSIAFVLGVLTERLFIRPVARFGEFPAVLTTLGLFLVFNELAPWLWGPENRAFPSLFGAGVLAIGKARVSTESVGTLVVMIAAVSVFFFVLHHTKIGLGMRAAAANAVSSSLSGVPAPQMFMLGWGLATTLATLAGVLIAPRLFLDASLMLGVIIYAFAAAALGGFTSLLGAVVGGLVIGLAETLASNYVDFIGSDLKILVPLTVLLVVLLVRPTGLFAKSAERAV